MDKRFDQRCCFPRTCASDCHKRARRFAIKAGTDFKVGRRIGTVESRTTDRHLHQAVFPELANIAGELLVADRAGELGLVVLVDDLRCVTLP